MKNEARRILQSRWYLPGLVRIGISLLLFSGCSEQQPPASEPLSADGPTGGTVQSASQEAPGITATDDKSSTSPNADTSFDLKPLTLSNLPDSSTSRSGGAESTTDGDSERQIQSIIKHLQPLQVLLGQWRGTTRREFGDFKAVDSHEWVWDLRTEPDRPALTIKSDKSPYLMSGRLSWDLVRKSFMLTAIDADGTSRQFTGEFSEPVHEIVGSDDKLHRVFRLEFTETDALSSRGEQWQLGIAQQENNRYLLEVSKRRGSAQFARFDTVSTQRDGTSFAASDSDYAERTCIISEGLGTMELAWKGRSYWVCCTGCRAAFEEDPEKWLARAMARTPDQ